MVTIVLSNTEVDTPTDDTVVGVDVVVAPDAAIAGSVAGADIAGTQAIGLEWRYPAEIGRRRWNRKNGSGSKMRYRQKR